MEKFNGPVTPLNSLQITVRNYKEGVQLVEIFSFQIARKGEEKTHPPTFFLGSDS